MDDLTVEEIGKLLAEFTTEELIRGYNACIETQDGAIPDLSNEYHTDHYYEEFRKFQKKYIRDYLLVNLTHKKLSEYFMSSYNAYGLCEDTIQEFVRIMKNNCKSTTHSDEVEELGPKSLT